MQKILLLSLTNRILDKMANRGGIPSRASPKRELCLPKRGLCPKESNGSCATGVQFEAWDPKNAGHDPRIREQELFFLQICDKDLFFLVFIPKFVKILAYFVRRPFAPSKNCLYPPSHATLAPGLDRSLLVKIRLNEGICFHKEFRAILSISALSSFLLFLTGVGATSKIMPFEQIKILKKYPTLKTIRSVWIFF